MLKIKWDKEQSQKVLVWDSDIMRLCLSFNLILLFLYNYVILFPLSKAKKIGEFLNKRKETATT